MLIYTLVGGKSMAKCVDCTYLDFNFGAKNILRELKNILVELFSTGEIDRIYETK